MKDFFLYLFIAAGLSFSIVLFAAIEWLFGRWAAQFFGWLP